MNNFIYLLKIKDGVYNLVYNNDYLNYNDKKLILSNCFSHPNSFWRIKKISNYYYLQIINLDYKLSYSPNKNVIFESTTISNYDLALWNFIEVETEKYIIRNKNNCYIKVNRLKITCEYISFKEASLINIIKIFEEVIENKIFNEIIDKEPIDILIKYIDLKDPNLKRNKIHQIEKDYDNEELKYSIRSIIKNIPWIRKIFILMPNEKVRFFKNINLINDKIVYIKDKDLLGYDSSNINAFLFNYWKMEKFGISDNFLMMDDDCFIGKKLKKTDFFDIENGKIVPSIITSNFLKISKDLVQEKYHFYNNLAKMSKEEQNYNIFLNSLYLTYLLIINIFKKDNFYIPEFTHNVIPVNIKELREIYELVYNSEYKKITLDYLYRDIGYVQFQAFYLSYTFIKYKRKVRDISYNYIEIDNAILGNYNFSLFCINKGAKNYTYLDFYKAKIVMEALFPIISPYEINNYSLSNLSYNVVYSMEEEIKRYKEKLKELNNISIILIFLIIVFFVFWKIQLYLQIKEKE